MSDSAVVDEDVIAAEVRVFGRVLVILEAFVPENQWLSNSELASLTGLPRSTVARLTSRLSRTGYLEQSAQATRFRLGLNVRKFGSYSMLTTHLMVLVRHCFQDVVEPAKAVLRVYRLEGATMRLLEALTPKINLVAASPIDEMLAVSTSDAGIAVLANLTETQMGSILAQDAKVENWRVAEVFARVNDAKDQIRQKGFYSAIGRGYPTVNSVTTVLVVHECDECYAFHLAGPETEFVVDRMNFEFGPLLTMATKKLAGELGLGAWLTGEVRAHE
ncbi:helix-turn-helix domain-containing protein [Paraburkholderia sp. RL17-337-BIB-A]|uniref:helix-turn-helix domain-containing protein n=1 Tax=Paraburkholderia sp. RL17-337-BIB-A TaxID=3031636 RepID=UPI000E70CF08